MGLPIAYNNNNIYLGKSNQAARKGTGPSKLATQKFRFSQNFQGMFRRELV